MPNVNPIAVEHDTRVAKLCVGQPPDRWFNNLYGDLWRSLEVGTQFQIDGVNEMVPEFGGPVVHLLAIPDNAVIVVPLAWFNSMHFRKIPALSGQQPLLFLEPQYQR